MSKASDREDERLKALFERVNAQTDALAKALPPGRDLWLIRVSGYGSFFFAGTEEEAETMRAHKAEWEGGYGCKYLLKPSVLYDILNSVKTQDIKGCEEE